MRWQRKSRCRPVRLASLVLGLCIPAVGLASDNESPSLEARFKSVVQPFLQSYCVSCHGAEEPAAKLDLTRYGDAASVTPDLSASWELVRQRLLAGDMPPADAPALPAAERRTEVLDWITRFRRREAERLAGDPGPLLPRRLSNAEYDYTLRDLIGLDLRLGREFPLDPATEAGFTNSGEALSMSPDLLRKYLAAARRVAEHLVLTPTGFAFASHPAVTETDRDKYCVQRIVDFYHRQPTDYADYFQAAWRYRHRVALGRPGVTLGELAEDARVSSRYLTTIWKVLDSREADAGPLAELRKRWAALPAPPVADQDVRAACEALRDEVRETRRAARREIPNLTVRGISTGSQPLVRWKNRQMAAARRHYAGDAGAGERPAWEQFCAVFPDAFYVAERGRVFLKESDEARGRLLSAGFHLMVGYFRDDQPLSELILDESGRRELDALWQELDFITEAPLRQYKDFIFFERAEPPRFMQGAEFDFARSEDKSSVSPSNMTRLEELYLRKARQLDARPEAVAAIQDYFRDMAAAIRRIETERQMAEPFHLAALEQFAARASRRPLSSDERESLRDFYQALRQQDRLSHDEAIRDTLASVLVSPHFTYLLTTPSAQDRSQPLDEYTLASRLSYFLWSSMPDEELLSQAAARRLQRPEVLVAQARRMLQDARIRGFATEFAGNWLEFRDFEQHNAVDRERFPQFTNDLRQAMYEEPIRFVLDVVQHDQSVLDFLYADHTFVNPVLARHYGWASASSAPDEWTRIEPATDRGRGGLLPMAVFLTKNSPGLRTSPVKRGYWVVRRLLGERIPPPPPAVPELPKSEADLGEQNLREVLARHRDNTSCAGCHQRFDSIGLAFEEYGPIGERRSRDLGGRPIDARANFPSGTEGTGLVGLKDYLQREREEEFLDNLCRKLLAYALGRGLLISDELLVEELRANLARSDYRLSSLIETIVTSRQFRFQRGREG